MKSGIEFCNVTSIKKQTATFAVVFCSPEGFSLVSCVFRLMFVLKAH